MRRKLILISILILRINAAQSQDFFYPNDLDSKFIPLQFKAFSKQLQFGKITVIDKRFDTSKFGYIKELTYRKLKTELSFESTLQEIINKGYKNKFDQNSTKSLLIVIRHFWLQKIYSSEVNNKKFEGNEIPSSSELSSCTVGFDVYLHNDSFYIPLFRVDTIFLGKADLYDAARDLIPKSFNYCINRANATDINLPGQKRKQITSDEMEAYYKKRLEHFRLKKDTAIDGIYVTFNDFLENKPVPKKFEVEYGELTDELYLTDGDNKTLFTDFWGYCDGGISYIKLGHKFFLLLKQNNTYDLLGVSGINFPSGFQPWFGSGYLGVDVLENATRLLLRQKKVKLSYKPMELNMETGKVY